jgi:RNA polymerase sigma-70 factor (ECF subfamily)
VAPVSHSPPTETLVARSRAGDADAYAELVRRHFRAAYAVALAVTREPAEAEDLAQEAFLVAHQRLHDCREPARFHTWLLQIVRNRALNRLEHLKIRSAHADTVRTSDRASGVPPVAGDLALRRRLLDALSDLTEREREVVLLHDLEGWTHSEIAEALDTSEGNCRQFLFQARRKLRTSLEAVKKEVTGGD